MARTTRPLTNTEVSRAKANDKDLTLHDGDGLFLMVKTSGKKLWRFRYQRPATKQRTMMGLGAFSALSLADTRGLRADNANIIPRQPRTYLYHAYLVYMEAHGYKNTLSLTMFGKGLPAMLKEYGLNYDKRRTNQGMQTNLTLKEESNGDWLPKCNEPVTG